MRIAVYPGSFDPVTNGHLDIVERTAKIFDKVYVSVLENPNKIALFSVEERKQLLVDVTGHISNVEIDSFSGLLVDYMRLKVGKVIIKGLRAVSDFEYEFQMAQLNNKLDDKVETLFMMTSIEYSYLSSSIVKEVARLNGSLKGLVPDTIINDIMQKYKVGVK